MTALLLLLALQDDLDAGLEQLAGQLGATEPAPALAELLKRHWAQVWTVTLMDSFQFGYEPYDRLEFRDWLAGRLEKGVSWRRMAQSILSAEGEATRNPAANFGIKYLTEGPEAYTTRVVKSFLGQRLNCAQCHDHPFDAWKQTDFYGLSSFVSRTQTIYTVSNSDFEA